MSIVLTDHQAAEWLTHGFVQVTMPLDSAPSRDDRLALLGTSCQVVGRSDDEHTGLTTVSLRWSS